MYCTVYRTVYKFTCANDFMFLNFLSDLKLKLKVVLPCDKLIAAISDVQNCDLLGRIRLVKFNNISLNIIQ